MPRLSSNRLRLSSEQHLLLKKEAITKGRPGAILRDFDSLLNFRREDDFPITPTHLLPIRALPVINVRLTHPIQQGLGRPQQKSYPHINGLYLKRDWPKKRTLAKFRERFELEFHSEVIDLTDMPIEKEDYLG